MLFVSFSQCDNSDSSGVDKVISMDLPFRTNPSGMWQIGFSKDTVLAFNQFELSTSSDTSDIIGLWHPGASQSEYYPYVGQNRGKVSKAEKTNGWAARAGQIPMEASNTGQYSMLRFVAPATGKYVVKVTFEGLHFNLSSTDVHVLLNSQRLFDDFVQGYGGDPGFHPIEGTRPSTNYIDTLLLQKGDIITFAVGYGKNKNHYNDTTGLIISIETI